MAGPGSGKWNLKYVHQQNTPGEFESDRLWEINPRCWDLRTTTPPSAGTPSMHWSGFMVVGVLYSRACVAVCGIEVAQDVDCASRIRNLFFIKKPHE